MEASADILAGCEYAVDVASPIEGRVARRKEVCRSRWGVSTRRIRGVDWKAEVVVG